MRKKKHIVVILCFLIQISFSGCAGSPVRTNIQAEAHRRTMVNLKLDMTPEQVIELMGQPDKTEMYRGKDDEVILVYFYITEGKDSWSRKWSEANYTPLVFENNKSVGWGWNCLNNTSQKYEFIIKELY